MWPCDWCLRLKCGYLLYRKSSINPPWVLVETGGLFNLQKTMVFDQFSIKNYNTINAEKLKNKKVGGHTAKDQNSN